MDISSIKQGPISLNMLAITAGPQLDLPQNVTPTNLETLLNGLLQQTEKQPYSFFVEEQQLDDELGLFLQAKKVSVQNYGMKDLLCMSNMVARLSLSLVMRCHVLPKVIPVPGEVAGDDHNVSLSRQAGRRRPACLLGLIKHLKACLVLFALRLLLPTSNPSAKPFTDRMGIGTGFQRLVLTNRNASRCQWRQPLKSYTSPKQCSGSGLWQDAQPPCQAMQSQCWLSAFPRTARSWPAGRETPPSACGT